MRSDEYYRIKELEDKHWWYRATRQAVCQELGNLPGDVKIIDLGCGTGGLIEILTKNNMTVYGVDISDLAIELTSYRNIKKELIKRCSLESLSFDDEEFDACVCIDVLYHKEVKNNPGALKEISRVLKKKGKFILQVPAFELLRGGHDDVVQTRHRFVKEEVRKMLTDTGFVDISIWYRNVWLFLLVFMWRNILNRNDNSDLMAVPRWLNLLLYKCNLFDNLLSKNVFFPFGTSIFCVAKKG